MNEDVRNEVLRRWYGGQSMRGIARDLHLSRKTVAGTIAGHQQQRAQGVTGLPAPPEVRGSQVDSYEAALREYLARYPKMSVVRLLEELRRRGLHGRLHDSSATGEATAAAILPSTRGAF